MTSRQKKQDARPKYAGSPSTSPYTLHPHFAALKVAPPPDTRPSHLSPFPLPVRFISRSAASYSQLVLIASPRRLAPPHPARPVVFALIMPLKRKVRGIARTRHGAEGTPGWARRRDDHEATALWTQHGVHASTNDHHDRQDPRERWRWCAGACCCRAALFIRCGFSLTLTFALPNVSISGQVPMCIFWMRCRRGFP